MLLRPLFGNKYQDRSPHSNSEIIQSFGVSSNKHLDVHELSFDEITRLYGAEIRNFLASLINISDSPQDVRISQEEYEAYAELTKESYLRLARELRMPEAYSDGELVNKNSPTIWEELQIENRYNKLFSMRQPSLGLSNDEIANAEYEIIKKVQNTLTQFRYGRNRVFPEEILKTGTMSCIGARVLMEIYLSKIGIRIASEDFLGVMQHTASIAVLQNGLPVLVDAGMTAAEDPLNSTIREKDIIADDPKKKMKEIQHFVFSPTKKDLEVTLKVNDHTQPFLSWLKVGSTQRVKFYPHKEATEKMSLTAVGWREFYEVKKQQENLVDDDSINSRKVEAALRAFSAAMNSDIPNANPINGKADVFRFLLKDEAQALRYNALALVCDPKNSYALYCLAFQLQKEGKHKHVVKLCKAALEDGPNVNACYNVYADSLCALERKEEAFEVLKLGICVSPEVDKYSLYLRAKPFYDTEFGDGNQPIEYYHEYATVLAGSGYIDDAVSICDQGIGRCSDGGQEKLRERKADILHGHGEYLFEKGQFEAASQYFIKAGETLERRKTCNFIGDCFLGLKNYKTAIIHYKKAIGINEIAYSWAKIGECYSGIGSEEALRNALTVYQKALHLCSDYPLATNGLRSAREKLEQLPTIV